MNLDFNENSERGEQLYKSFNISEERYSELVEIANEAIMNQLHNSKQTSTVKKSPVIKAVIDNCYTIEEVACMMFMTAEVMMLSFGNKKTAIDEFLSILKDS